MRIERKQQCWKLTIFEDRFFSRGVEARTLLETGGKYWVISERGYQQSAETKEGGIQTQTQSSDGSGTKGQFLKLYHLGRCMERWEVRGMEAEHFQSLLIKRDK